MSDRVLSFVGQWLDEHLSREDDATQPAEVVARRLAAECVMDALATGIEKTEIDEEFDDLAAFIAGEILEADDREEGQDDDSDEESPEGTQ